jgi:PAS domain S-box-containing protein
MSAPWLAILTNLAMISVLVLLWGFISDLSDIIPRQVRRIGYGLICGLFCYIVIVYGTQVLPGFRFDIRHSLLAIAGYFGGPISALIAGSIALIARVEAGGAGTLSGIIGIGISTAIGLIVHSSTHERRHLLSTHVMLATALMPGIALAFLAIPAEVRASLFQTMGPPLFSVNFVATLVTAILIGRQLNQRDTLRTNRIYTRMVEELPECLNAKDRDGRFIAANDATARLMRASSAKDLIGKTDFDFYPPAVAEQFRKDELQVMETKANLWLDQQVVFPEGKTLWLSTLKSPLYDQTGKVVGLITRNYDITEKRKLDEMKSQFVSTINHEIRTPLTSINGALALLAAGAAGPLTESVRRLVEIGHSNAQELVNLVNDVLDLEKIVSGTGDFDLSPLLLQTALSDAAHGLGGYMPEKGVRLRIKDNHGENVYVMAHPARLQQVLRNLLSNAIKFAPRNSEVVMEITAGPSEVRLAILDEGPGVPAEFEPRLFQRFEQADGSYRRGKGGTGLGLNIVKEIMERSGGKVWYERRDARLTAFTVSFPRVESEDAGVVNWASPSKDPIR